MLKTHHLFQTDHESCAQYSIGKSTTNNRKTELRPMNVGRDSEIVSHQIANQPEYSDNNQPYKAEMSDMHPPITTVH